MTMPIDKGMMVSFHYRLKDGQGNLIEDSHQGEPLPYLHGFGKIVPGLELAMTGRVAGDEYVVTLSALEAYGVRDEEKVYDVTRTLFSDMSLSSGMMCHLTNEDGEQELVTVVEFDDTTVTVDANHPYAGRSLTFDVKIIEVRPATDEELSSVQ